MKKIILKYTLFIGLLPAIIFSITTSCSNYLDVIPDETSIKDFFSDRSGVEQYFGTCCSYIYKINSISCDPSYLAGSEIIYLNKNTSKISNSVSTLNSEITKVTLNSEMRKATLNSEITEAIKKYPAFGILYGKQNKYNPYCDFWTGEKGGVNLWAAINDCNIFLKYIESANCISDGEKNAFKSDIYLLKAYYNLFLMRLYGPIPIFDEAIEAGAPMNEFMKERESIDNVVKYIVSLCDKVILSDNASMNASKGNSVDASMSTSANCTSKSILQAKIIKAEALLWNASQLYNGNSYFNTSNINEVFNEDFDNTKWKLAADALKEAIDLYNSENHNLGDQKSEDLKSKNKISKKKTAVKNNERENNSWAKKGLYANPQTVNKFYTSNGLPLENDITETQMREPRYYQKIYMQENGDNLYYILTKMPKIEIPILGKETHLAWNILMPTLSQLQLEYAEALNEYLENPNEEIYTYIDKVRQEAGLPSIKKAWKEFSDTPEKPLHKAGVREIIHNEILNETAFTGQRFYLQRRWNEAINQIYVEKPYYFLFPIPNKATSRNPLLKQNPGW